MANITLKVDEGTMDMLKDYTDNHTQEEVQELLQGWFNAIKDIPWGFTLALHMQIDDYVNGNLDDDDD